MPQADNAKVSTKLNMKPRANLLTSSLQLSQHIHLRNIEDILT